MQNTVDQLFTQLDNWRYLLAYALERRVDIYFSLYLKEVFLIELKTDMRSSRVLQDEYLLKAQKITVPGLVDGIIQIYKTSKQKIKYNYLIEVLENMEWLKKNGKTILNKSHAYRISIIYIQPTNEKNEENNVCFDDIISLLHAKEDAFSKRFTKSLEEWKMNPNIT